MIEENESHEPDPNGELIVDSSDQINLNSNNEDNRTEQNVHKNLHAYDKLGLALSHTPIEDVFPYFFKTLNYLGCCKHRVPYKKPLTEI